MSIHLAAARDRRAAVRSAVGRLRAAAESLHDLLASPAARTMPHGVRVRYARLAADAIADAHMAVAEWLDSPLYLIRGTAGRLVRRLDRDAAGLAAIVELLRQDLAREASP